MAGICDRSKWRGYGGSECVVGEWHLSKDLWSFDDDAFICWLMMYMQSVCVCVCVCFFLFICDVESWFVFVGFWKLMCVAWGSHSALRSTCWGNKSCIRWIQYEKGTLHLPNLSTIAMETETQACRWCTCSKSIRNVFISVDSEVTT
jgi:hypothetical protein